MKRFYFPHLFLTPASSEEVCLAPYRRHPRRWDVSIFDLYSLVAEEHPMQMSAELMQIFLPKVSLEISIDAEEHAEAKNLLEILQAMLYLRGIQPTVAPFATSYSLNEYAGTNYRSSSNLRDKLPEGMRIGITAKDSRIEGWPNDLTFSILQGE
ncbi:hypothetical protein JMM61_21200, partial [Rhodovulum sulfidophilum]